MIERESRNEKKTHENVRGNRSEMEEEFFFSKKGNEFSRDLYNAKYARQHVY